VNQKIFENLADGCQQLAGQIAIQHSAISQNKLRLEEKWLRQGSHKAVEWHLSFYFQQNVVPPGGGTG
jgi:hypothetical protein